MSRIETTSTPTPSAVVSAANPAYEAPTTGRLGRHVLTAGVVAAWLLVPTSLAAVLLFNRLVTDAGRPELAQRFTDGVVYILAMVSASTVGAGLAMRRPRHPVGWLFLAL
jgi:hypothetical protein